MLFVINIRTTGVNCFYHLQSTILYIKFVKVTAAPLHCGQMCSKRRNAVNALKRRMVVAGNFTRRSRAKELKAIFYAEAM